MSVTVKFIEDKNGKTLKVKEMNGHHYPPFASDSLKHATNVKARPDDILIVNYPKAGTHWTFEIIRFLLAGTVNLPVEEKDSYMIEDVKPEVINDAPSPRNINCHFHVDSLSPDFLKQKSKIIYISRDPRDIVCSLFNHHKKLPYFRYDGEWEDHLYLFLEGNIDYDSWFEHTRGWEKCMKEHPDNPFLVLSYEAMQQDHLTSVKRIADFIGVKHSEEFLREVQEKTSFDSMTSVRKAQPQSGYIAEIMYRKGKVGDWKNWFTVTQSEIFNKVFEKEMAGTDAYKLYSHTKRKGDEKPAV